MVDLLEFMTSKGDIPKKNLRFLSRLNFCS